MARQSRSYRTILIDRAVRQVLSDAELVRLRNNYMPDRRVAVRLPEGAEDLREDVITWLQQLDPNIYLRGPGRAV